MLGVRRRRLKLDRNRRVHHLEQKLVRVDDALDLTGHPAQTAHRRIARTIFAPAGSVEQHPLVGPIESDDPLAELPELRPPLQEVQRPGSREFDLPLVARDLDLRAGLRWRRRRRLPRREVRHVDECVVLRAHQLLGET
ncbi:MAG: hypothetical protein EXS13_08625 [Planctomycetes bacterium]|nr:hypothetical protein [Planctomycetota bacterium]